MNISDVSRATDLSVKTIRYYEREGLIEPDRKQNGYRNFDIKDIDRLRFIRRARSFGFSVSDCRALLALYENPARASADVKALARKRFRTIAQQIADLRGRQEELLSLIKECSGDEAPQCSILDGLAGEKSPSEVRKRCPSSG